MGDLFDDLEESAETAALLAKKYTAEKVYTEEEKEAEQRSKEWFMNRLGCFSSSLMPDLMSRLKNGNLSAKAKNVIRKISYERKLSEEGKELYVYEQMAKSLRQTRWGNKYEDDAAEAVSERLGIELIEATFIRNDQLVFFGGSIDRQTPNGKIIVEIKCPYDGLVHEDNLSMKEVDRTHAYYAQDQSHLLNYPNAEICIFASYDPRLSPPHNLATFEVKRDKEYQLSIIEALNEAEMIINGEIKM